MKPAAFILARRAGSVLVLLGLGLPPSGARADDWKPAVTATALWHSNASHAEAAADTVRGYELTADLLAAQRTPVGRDDAYHLALHLAGDAWPRFHGLLCAEAGGRAEWQHKFGVAAVSPVLSFETAADASLARESGRSGVSAGFTTTLRKRFNNLTRGALRHEFAWVDARLATFDRRARETSLELDRDLSDLVRLTLTARFQDGDVVSYATASRPDLAQLARHRTTLGSFGRPMTAYRIDARTWSGRVALLRALSQRSAVVVAYEGRETRRAPLRFVDHICSVALAHQF